MDTAGKFDRAATAFSLACIAHCLALPALAVALPFVASVAEAEWVHWIFAILAVAASGAVIAKDASSRTPTFLVPALVGLALVVFGLFAHDFGVEEAIPTVIGGVLIAGAHISRIFRARAPATA